MWYPLKFYPIYKEKIWGGSLIKDIFKRNTPYNKTGESYELSCFDENISMISNGKYKGKSFDKLIDEYPIEILGRDVYRVYGKRFPLLFKYIDAKTDLSVQVHPSEANVQQMSKGRAKTECWFILKSENGRINIGFKRKFSLEEIKEYINSGGLFEILEYRNVYRGDTFLIKPCTVHAICSGVLLVEIQQASDTTYRLFDYNRPDKNGNLRKLHIEEGITCINPELDFDKSIRMTNHIEMNDDYNISKIVSGKFFTTNKIKILKKYETSSLENSFKVMMFIEGEGIINYRTKNMIFGIGDTILIPSAMGSFTIEGRCEVLETFIEFL